ncbi:MAG: S8 family serine peptidase [Caldisericia bacterium]|nr:S8 family serine peptidase [Caldisericia bacterium]
MKQFQKRSIPCVTLIFFLSLCLFFVSSLNADAQQYHTELSPTIHSYIVELIGEPLALRRQSTSSEGYLNYQSIVKLQHSLFLQDCFNSIESQFDINHEYYHVFNGFSLYVSEDQLPAIESSPYVKTMYLAQEYYLQRDVSVPQTEAPYCWESLTPAGLFNKGQGMLIGIIDTGVDYRHGELGGGLGKTWDKKWYKVRTGYDFSEMNPLPYTIGMSNHGTHVAGIAAGNGEAGIAVGENKYSGVAPAASLSVYKVFSNKQSSTGEAALLMALEQSIIDGCDVINLSLGKNFGWSNDPLSIACDRLAEAGIIVVASAGNSGLRNSTLNPFPIHAPGSSLRSISVAASDATLKDGFYFSTEKTSTHFAIGNIVKPTPKASSQPIPMVLWTDTITNTTFHNDELKGKAVMVFPSDLSLQTLYQYAENSGIHSLLCVNSQDTIHSTPLPSDYNTISMMCVSVETGTYLRSIINSCEEPFLIHYGYQVEAVTMTSFSSQGPTPDFALKPEITAPGYRISSCLTNHQYGIMSGTSMSSPHVAGGVALLKQLHPEWSIDEIKSILVNYAEPLYDPLRQERYSIYLQGSGTMNLRKSFSANLVVSPSTISFGCIEKNQSQWIHITNKGEDAQTIELQCHSPTHQNATVVVSPYRFTIQPNETTSVQITLEVTDNTVPGFGEFWLEGVLAKGNSFQVPTIFYHGLYPPMEPILTSYMFPTLAVSPNFDGDGDQTNFVCLSPYNIEGIEIDLFDPNNVFVQNLYYHRGSLGAGYYSILFVGLHNGKPLEEGMYTIKAYVLPNGKDYKKVNNWTFGKESKTLIDVTPPHLKLNHTWIGEDTLHIQGSISDENASFGLFLYYELDYDDGSMLSVNHDGTFDHTIQINDEHCFIRFTAQDIAGNRSSVKKRIPYSSF